MKTNNNPSEAATVAAPEKSVNLYSTVATKIGRDIQLTEMHRFDDAAGAAATKAAQLQALLHMTYGEGASAFANMADELRENLMYLASDLALEIRVLCELGIGGAA